MIRMGKQKELGESPCSSVILSTRISHEVLGFKLEDAKYKRYLLALYFISKTSSVALVRERTILSDCRLPAKLAPTFADKGCHVVSVTDSYGRNLGFLDRSPYFFFHVAPQLYSRG
jgi:hypothetical protein